MQLNKAKEEVNMQSGLYTQTRTERLKTYIHTHAYTRRDGGVEWEGKVEWRKE